MPSKEGPTSLGSAALEPGKLENLEGSDLKAFLKVHHLEHWKDADGIEWRAKKLQIALDKNAKLINPRLDDLQKL